MKNFFTTRRMTMLAIFSALSFVLYILSFPLPFMFPGFLSVDFSEVPILLAGFMLGPISGAVTVLVRFGLKSAYGTNTMYVGETADLIFGLILVLTSSIIYKYNRTKKGAVIGLAAGVTVTTGMAVIFNRFVLVPLYLQLFFGGNWGPLLDPLSALYRTEITRQNFYAYYLLLAVLPFNLLRLTVCAVITFLLYKRLQRFINGFGARLEGRVRQEHKEAAAGKPEAAEGSEPLNDGQRSEQ